MITFISVSFDSALSNPIRKLKKKVYFNLSAGVLNFFAGEAHNVHFANNSYVITNAKHFIRV